MNITESLKNITQSLELLRVVILTTHENVLRDYNHPKVRKIRHHYCFEFVKIVLFLRFPLEICTKGSLYEAWSVQFYPLSLGYEISFLLFLQRICYQHLFVLFGYHLLFLSSFISSPKWSADKRLLWFIKWRLASVLKIEKCRHTDAKNSELGSKIRNRFFW